MLLKSIFEMMDQAPMGILLWNTGGAIFLMLGVTVVGAIALRRSRNVVVLGIAAVLWVATVTAFTPIATESLTFWQEAQEVIELIEAQVPTQPEIARARELCSSQQLEGCLGLSVERTGGLVIHIRMDEKSSQALSFRYRNGELWRVSPGYTLGPR